MSLTTTHTHTATYARHIASKIAADLKRVQRLVGRGKMPPDSEIDDYQQEAGILLQHQCLEEVTYGFRRHDEWIFALKYRVNNNVLSGGGDDPGGIFPYPIGGDDFLSVLTYSDNWRHLDPTIKNTIRIRRVPGKAPTSGDWNHDRHYISGNLGMQRAMYRK